MKQANVKISSGHTRNTIPARYLPATSYAVFRAAIKLKLFRGTLFLNNANCMDEPNIVTVNPFDRTPVTVGAGHQYFIANPLSNRKVCEVMHRDNLTRTLANRTDQWSDQTLCYILLSRFPLAWEDL